jgi:hypothetical protein
VIYDLDWDEDRQNYVSSRKVRRPLGPNAPHIPNKQEARELRRLMAKSGNSAEEVKADKGNRRKLAAAQKSPMQGDWQKRREYLVKMVKRSIARQMGLPATHPDVEAAYRNGAQGNAYTRRKLSQHAGW